MNEAEEGQKPRKGRDAWNLYSPGAIFALEKSYTNLKGLEYHYFTKRFYALLCKALILVKMLLAGSNGRPKSKRPKQQGGL